VRGFTHDAAPNTATRCAPRASGAQRAEENPPHATKSKVKFGFSEISALRA
jgi:hypothetical protein